MKSSLAVFEAAIRIKSTRLVKSFLKTRKRKYGNKRYFYINLHLKDRVDIEFIAPKGELMAKGGSDIIYPI